MILGQGGQQEQMGTDWSGHLFLGHCLVWQLFGTCSFHPLAGPIFHIIIQIALSSNDMLLVYVAYSISVI